ncbi:MAG: dephospho-CoA kinase [Bacteroidota bacterium]
MLKVGITGGIGSGKTTICKLFEVLRIPIYYADIRAKALMTEDPELVKRIKEKFGEKTYWTDGSLDRKYLASIIFKDKEKLRELNELVHPAVFRDAEKWQSQQKDVPYTLREAAIAFESGSYKFLDKMITVFAPEEIRIDRVIKRDFTNRSEVLSRIAKQMPELEKIKRSDFVIINDGEHSLVSQVLDIHDQLKRING